MTPRATLIFRCVIVACVGHAFFMLAVLRHWDENLQRWGTIGDERTPLRLKTLDFVAFPILADWLQTRAADPSFWTRLENLGVASADDFNLFVFWPMMLLCGSLQWAVIAAVAAWCWSSARQARAGHCVQ